MNISLYDINHSYMTIPAYGLIFHKNKLNDVVNNIDYFESIKYLRHEIKVKQAEEDYDKYIKEINITPVDKFCYGSCNYCYYNNHIDKEKIELTPERLDTYFKKIQSYLHKDILYKFTGGSCFLHSDIMSLLSVCKKYAVDDSLCFRFHADLIYPQEYYNKMLDVLTQLCSWDIVKKIELYITVDFGSETRNSNTLNLTYKDILNRANEVVNLFSKYEKIQIELKTNYNDKTNLKVLLEKYEEYYYKNVWLISNPVRDLNFSPSVKKLLKIINETEDRYKTNIVYARQYVVCNEKVNKAMINNSVMFDMSIETLDDGIYYLSKYSSDCIAFRHSFGITSKSYLSCFTGYLESTEEENITKITPKCNNYEKFITLTDECLACDLVGVCMRCNLRRHSLSCNNVPSLKLWETFLWDKKVSNFLGGFNYD